MMLVTLDKSNTDHIQMGSSVMVSVESYSVAFAKTYWVPSAKTLSIVVAIVGTRPVVANRQLLVSLHQRFAELLMVQ